MKILCVIPPYIPSYFNAGHHLHIFQVGAYLRQIIGVDEVVCMDLAALNTNWKQVCALLVKGFDVIVVMNDFDGIDSFQRFVTYAKKLTTEAYLITFGRGSKQVSKFFERYGFDAIAASGDYEAAVGSYIEYLFERSQCQGVIIQTNNDYTSTTPGVYLEPHDWVLPNIEDIPYSAYDRMYQDDHNKFCGIPQRRELVVPVARGCPINCEFCDVTKMQGLRERRLSVERVVAYVKDSFERLPFDYVSFYAPTFTLKSKWVFELCEQFTAANRLYPWKCTTTLSYLNEDLITAMANAGCVRISVGVETLNLNVLQSLPSAKHENFARLNCISKICQVHEIELNCFVILGLPGDSPDAVSKTIEKIIDMGARVRPTIYTPYHLMTSDMDEATYASFNRQLFVNGIVSKEDARAYYRLFYQNPRDQATKVMNKIPLGTLSTLN